ncbi:MAG: DUF1987 domain-containing protein [Bacteroidetes bacterium]|nr:MAG: DUF1987 domain-containing protein [Bacteroidota bacterium]
MNTQIESLIIKGTIDSPGIQLNSAEKIGEIEGRSFPDNAFELYKPVLNWLDNYIDQMNDSIDFHFKLDYFDSISQKYFYDILMKLKKLEKKGKKVTVFWWTKKDDSDMIEIGKEYEMLSNMSFEFKTDL